MAIKIYDQTGGLDEFAKAIPAAIQGYQDAEDRQLKRMALEAKLVAEEGRKLREQADFAMAVGKEFELPAGADLSEPGLLERGILSGQFKRRQGLMTDEEIKKQNLLINQQKLQLAQQKELREQEKAATKRAEDVEKKELRKTQKKEQAELVSGEIDRALNIIQNEMGTTGFIGSALSYIPQTDAHQLSKVLDTVRANIGFDELNKMRASSPTGGALGQVSEREIGFLQAVMGNLEQSQTKEELEHNLKRLQNGYLDVIHGPGKGPKRHDLARPGDVKPMKLKTNEIEWE
jgi:hypothetical protein